MTTARSIRFPLRRTALAALLLCAGTAPAAPVSWVGPNDSFWDLAGNWSPGLPGGADDALLGAFDTVFRSGNVAVNSLLGTGRLTVNAGTLSVANASSVGSLVFSGGTLGGAGSFDVSGSTTWTAGTFTGTGSTALADSTLSGNGLKDITQRAVTFAGTTSWSNAGANQGRIRTGSGAHLINGGSWRDQNGFDNRISNDFGGAVSAFTNSGSYDKSGAGVTEIGIAFHNTGTVGVQAGTLNFSGGGTADGGSFDVAAGAVLQFGGGNHLLSNVGMGPGTGLVRITGGTVGIVGALATPGPLEISGGMLTIGDSGSAAGLAFSGGTLGGAGSFSVGGSTSWTAGTLTGTGSTVLADSTLSGNGLKDITQRAVTFAGTTSWSNAGVNQGRIRTGSGAHLINSGSWRDQNDFDNRISNDFGGAASAFTNTGSYRKTGTGSTEIGIAFHNTGTVGVQAGTLNLSGGGTADGGSFDVAAGAVLQFGGGSHLLSNVGMGPGTGLVRISAGTVGTVGALITPGALEVTGGTLSVGDSGSAAGLVFSSGTINGAGSLSVGGHTTWTAGTFGGTGSTVLADGTLGGNGLKDITQRTVDFAGTTTWSNAAGSQGRIRTGSAARLINSGSWQDQNDFDNRISNDFGGAVSAFTNNGSYRKTGTGSTEIGVVFHNPGSVALQAGTLNLSGGGTADGGSFDVAAGAVLQFGGGSHTLSNVATGPGTGRVRISAGTVGTVGALITPGALEVTGGTLSVGDSGNAAGLVFSSGTINGAGSLSVGGHTTWTAGTFGGTGSTVLADSTLSGNGLKDITQRAVAFAGTTTWSNAAGGQGRIRTGSAARLINSGSWLDQNDFDNRISNDFGGSSSTFDNTGLYTKTGSATTDLSGVVLDNGGVIDVQAGTLQVPAAFHNRGTLQGGGRFATTATLRNSGTVAPTGLLTLAGAYAQTDLGVLALDLQDAAVHERWVVTGAAALAGQLALTCLLDCSFAVGDTLLIVDAAPNALSGTFENLLLSGFGGTNFIVSYDLGNGDVLLTAAAVPEPPAALLWLAGGLLITHLHRRRRPAR